MNIKNAIHNKVYILLGSNLGDRYAYIKRATELIEENIGTLVAVSNVYETESWGMEDQPAHLNQALIVNTRLDALEVLKNTQSIEKLLGRTKKSRWDNRIIDIDIIFFNQEIINLEKLTIPHPHFQERNFAIIPFSEIAGDYKHPIFHKSIKEIMDHSQDALKVKKYRNEASELKKNK
ncbi:MAG TPA: 2-amino-4-hydroxy-6-hydroxymethyldihydropteridine diphosphokinase [Edaphocola sp.]|nr:2-amino-4-hydroxy-6-hydroxymethyldihydropteridine diphosphokinase [Edaphocola sp.]